MSAQAALRFHFVVPMERRASSPVHPEPESTAHPGLAQWSDGRPRPSTPNPHSILNLFIAPRRSAVAPGPRSTLPFSADAPVREIAFNHSRPASAPPSASPPRSALAPERVPPWSPAVVARTPGSRTPRCFALSQLWVLQRARKSSTPAQFLASCTEGTAPPISARIHNQHERRFDPSYQILQCVQSSND